jgi:phosphatidate cytidylyltransferase
MLSSLLVRTLSAIILLPLVFGLIYLGGNTFFIAIALILGLAIFEFVQLLKKGGYAPSLFFAWGFGGLGLFVARDPTGLWLRPAMAGLLGSTLVWHMFQPQRSAPTADWALTVISGLYIGWLGGHLVALREAPDGIKWLLLPLLITWCADSGAYLVGSMWGRKKLAPRLSPGKTWEGTLGGWLTAVVSGGLIALILDIKVFHGLFIGGLLGIASPLGDLGVSMVKRQVGAKDTGQLIPGHGGMFDRLDSILFTTVICYYYIQWLIW